MPATKTQRWLDLLALLLGRTIPLTVEEIMDRVPAYAEKWSSGDATARATARRTFERDKDDLRAAGIPLEPSRYSVNFGAEQIEGYRLAHGDFYLPYVKLLEPVVPTGPREGSRTERGEQAAAVASRAAAPYRGLGTIDLSSSEARWALQALHRAAALPAFPFAVEARSARRKLEFDLRAEAFPADPVVWAERPGAAAVLERLRVLSDALLARKRVAFRYRGIHRAEVTQREVEPYGLFFQREWYLVARDPSVEALRTFRVSRMEAPQAHTRGPKTPDYEIPSDFVLREHLDRSAWELADDGEVIEAAVRFRFPLALQVARNQEGELLHEEEDGSALRTFRVSRRGPFLRWILSLGGEARIVSPPELHDELEDLVREVSSLYAEVGQGDG